MPRPTVPPPPDRPAGPLFPAGLLETVFDMSPVAFQLLRPLFGPDGTAVVDFTLDYLNPAGQRMLGLPVRETQSMLVRFPHTGPAGIFDFYRRVFETGEPGEYEVNYQADGLDNYFRFRARRSGPLLVVSFTDTADHGRSAVEAVLRQSQAREQAALADAEAQRTELQRLLEQAPVAVAMLRGPQYVIELANPAVCALWGRTPAQALGTPLFELLPEVAGQGFEELLDGVLTTGVPFVAHELPSRIDRGGRLETVHWNFVYAPLRAADGHIAGVTVVAADVSQQVQAREQVQALNQQLAVANNTLRATNAEVGAHNAALRRTEQRLRELNQTLEARVAERTQAAQAARAHAEMQRARLERLFMAAPAAICILAGPDMVFELVNPTYERLFGGRPLRGLPAAVAFPETAGHAVRAQLRRVYATGLSHEERALHLPLDPRDGGPLEDRYFNLVQQARRNEHGRIDGVLIFAFEVTGQETSRRASEASARQVQGLNQQLAALNNKLFAANAALAEVNQALGESNDELGVSNQDLARTNVDLDTFVYTASHDLKGPITDLDGLLGALREELPAGQPAPVADILRLMRDSVTRFQRTIEQLSIIGAMQQGPGSAPPAAPVLLAAVVRDVCLDLATLVAAAGAHLAVDVPAAAALAIPEKSLRSVVYNLLSNALKYRHPDRVARVRLRCRPGPQATGWVLEVRDNGLGLHITPDRPLFGLFQRYHTHVEGTGVGLYVVKKLVENAGGRIAVRSELGVGSVFTVYFKA